MKKPILVTHPDLLMWKPSAREPTIVYGIYNSELDLLRISISLYFFVFRAMLQQRTPTKHNQEIRDDRVVEDIR